MIYLFDDKKTRQQSYGWSEKEFEQWSDYLTLITDYSDYLNLDLNDILADNNIILYHESFSTCVPYNERLNYQSFHKSILEGNNLGDIKVAIFSGSITSRAINNNIAHLPVTNLYTNLKCFLIHLIESDFDFKYLLWGEEYLIEQNLVELIDEFVNENEGKDTDNDWSNVFFAKVQKYSIDAPSDDCVERTLWLGRVSDEDLDNYIHDWFSEIEFDALYIPLCFGRTLSDYNGLRFAIHIRCTNSLNRNKPIYIYSPVKEEYLLKSPYFDILKTRGVKLIGMSFADIKASSGKIKSLTIHEVSQEMKKIHLPVPQNYEDSHSIANEWAIYRWAVATNSEDSGIDLVKDTIKSNLYFKHLTTVSLPGDIEAINHQKLLFEDQLAIINKELIGNTEINILYVDDDADKGWSEIMTNIIYDINHIRNFDYIGEELKSLSHDEIINLIVNKVKERKINILLLDFRLHREDHNSEDIEKITSVQILKKVKEYNPGIQVIIFSATNKVWNLLTLQKFGADGFVIKEGVDNSKDPTFTARSIENFISSMSMAISNRYKKYLYETVSNLNETIKKDVKKHKLDKELQKAVCLFYDMAYSSLPESSNQSNYDHSFINYFRIIEAISNEIIDTDNPQVEENIITGEKRYRYQFRNSYEFLKDYDEMEFSNSSTEILTLPKRSLPFVQKLYNLFSHLGVFSPSTYDMLQKRNAITHPNLKKNDKIDPIILDDVLLAANISFKCLQNMKQIKDKK